MFKKRGIVLITTLAFVTVLVMFSVSIAQQAKDTLKSGVGFSDSEQAYLAALSGIEFAKGNLFISKQWGTDTLSENLEDSDNKIKIESSGKWVRGKIGYKSDNNYISEFSISFDTNPADGICKYPSCNNLSNSASIEATSSNQYHRDVPANAFYVVSRGASGKSVKYVEAVLFSAGPSVLSSGTMVCGDINIDGANLTAEDDIDYSDKAFLSILRNDTKGQSSVTSSGTLTSFNSGEIKITNNNITQNKNNLNHLLNLSESNKGNVILNAKKVDANGLTMTDPANSVSGLSCNSNSVFDGEDLKSMDDYAVATAGITCENTLKGGTYAFIKDCTEDSNGKKNTSQSKWVYIDNAASIADNSTYEQRATSLVNLLNTDSSILSDVTKNNAIEFGTSNDDGNRTIKIKDNIKADGNVNFIVLNKVNPSSEDKNAVAYEPSNDTVDFTIASKKQNGNKEVDDPVFMCDKNLYIDGEVTGSGKMFANGYMSFNSGSSLETKPQSGVSVWASQDVNIQPAKSISNETLESTEGQNQLQNAIEKKYKEKGKTDAEAKEAAQKAKDSYVDDSLTIEAPPQSGSDTGTQETVTPSITIEWTGEQNNGINCYKLIVSNGLSIEGTLPVMYFADNQPNGCRLKDSSNNYYTVSVNKISGNERPANFDDFEIIFRVDNSLQTTEFLFNASSNSNKIDSSYPYPEVDNSTSTGLYCVKNDLAFLKFNFNIGETKYPITSSTTTGNIQPSTTETPPAEDENKTDGTDTENLTENEVNSIVSTAIQSNPTRLIGTVYSAEGSINIDGGHSEFDILGALITLKGSLTMENILRASLTYDPDYVPFFKDKGIITNTSFMRVF